jgi:hypothetical protein
MGRARIGGGGGGDGDGESSRLGCLTSSRRMLRTRTLPTCSGDGVRSLSLSTILSRTTRTGDGDRSRILSLVSMTR